MSSRSQLLHILAECVVFSVILSNLNSKINSHSDLIGTLATKIQSLEHFPKELGDKVSELISRMNYLESVVKRLNSRVSNTSPHPQRSRPRYEKRRFQRHLHTNRVPETSSKSIEAQALQAIAENEGSVSESDNTESRTEGVLEFEAIARKLVNTNTPLDIEVVSSEESSSPSANSNDKVDDVDSDSKSDSAQE